MLKVSHWARCVDVVPRSLIRAAVGCRRLHIAQARIHRLAHRRHCGTAPRVGLLDGRRQEQVGLVCGRPALPHLPRARGAEDEGGEAGRCRGTGEGGSGGAGSCTWPGRRGCEGTRVTRDGCLAGFDENMTEYLHASYHLLPVSHAYARCTTSTRCRMRSVATTRVLRRRCQLNQSASFRSV
jgi:hypothetical protein